MTRVYIASILYGYDLGVADGRETLRQWRFTPGQHAVALMGRPIAIPTFIAKNSRHTRCYHTLREALSWLVATARQTAEEMASEVSTAMALADRYASRHRRLAEMLRLLPEDDEAALAWFLPQAKEDLDD